MIPTAFLLGVLASTWSAQAASPAAAGSIEECERRLAEHPDDRSAQFALGFALVREGTRLDRARAVFETAERTHGPHWYAALELGVIHELEGDLRAAASEYQRSIGISRGLDPRPAGSTIAEDELVRVEREIDSILTVASAEKRVRRDLSGIVAALVALFAAAVFTTRSTRN